MNSYCFFFFNDTATTEIYTLSLHDALPISPKATNVSRAPDLLDSRAIPEPGIAPGLLRSEEHTSELQSQSNLVCRLLLEKKKKTITESTRKTISARLAQRPPLPRRTTARGR